MDHDKKTIGFQLYFNQSEMISRFGVKDELDIKFLQPSNFTTIVFEPLKLKDRSED